MMTLSSHSLPRQITGIAHPLVADMYLKKDYRRGSQFAEDVLVIEARSRDDEREDENFEDYLLDLLTDLDDLKTQVERQVGSFHRIDIRTQ